MLIPLFTVNELARYTERERRRSARDDLTGLPNRRALFRRDAVAGPGVRAAARPGARATSGGWPCCCSTSTSSGTSTTRSGTRSGTGCSARSRPGWSSASAPTAWWPGSAATSSRCWRRALADPSAASVLAERVADALAEPVTLDGLPLDVTAAIGVAIYPDHGTDHTTLLRHAEVAMYDAKHRAATYAVYSPESDHNSPERLELLADLRRALDVARPDEIQLYYQPQVDMATGEVVGVEALLRWHHPQRGLVSPEHLIRVAEHTAVMRLLTSRVLEDAIGQLAKWQAQGLMLRASINVSVRDLTPAGAGRPARRPCSPTAACRPNQVQLEITEGALMADPRRVLVTLHRLDTLGVALSLDDFGTGYSSLQHLRRLPLAEVKIDRSFVLGMATDPDDAAVVGSIIDLARALGLRVVAEGVEDDRTRRMLLGARLRGGPGLVLRPADAGRRPGRLAAALPAAPAECSSTAPSWPPVRRRRPVAGRAADRAARELGERRQIDSLRSVPHATLRATASVASTPRGHHGRHLPRGGRASRAPVAARRHRRGAGPLRRPARRDPAGGRPGRRGRGGRHPADLALGAADQRAPRGRRRARA